MASWSISTKMAARTRRRVVRRGRATCFIHAIAFDARGERFDLLDQRIHLRRDVGLQLRQLGRVLHGRCVEITISSPPRRGRSPTPSARDADQKTCLSPALRAASASPAPKFAASGFPCCIHFNTSAKEAEGHTQPRRLWALWWVPGSASAARQHKSSSPMPLRSSEAAGCVRRVPRGSVRRRHSRRPRPKLRRASSSCDDRPGGAGWIAHVRRRTTTSDDGSIVFVSSRGALRGEPLAPAYGASKGGLNSLIYAVAGVWPERISASPPSLPGFINTAMAAPVLAGERGDGIRDGRSA